MWADEIGPKVPSSDVWGCALRAVGLAQSFNGCNSLGQIPLFLENRRLRGLLSCGHTSPLQAIAPGFAWRARARRKLRGAQSRGAARPAPPGSFWPDGLPLRGSLPGKMWERGGGFSAHSYGLVGTHQAPARSRQNRVSGFGQRAASRPSFRSTRHAIKNALECSAEQPRYLGQLDCAGIAKSDSWRVIKNLPANTRATAVSHDDDT